MTGARNNPQHRRQNNHRTDTSQPHSTRLPPRTRQLNSSQPVCLTPNPKSPVQLRKSSPSSSVPWFLSWPGLLIERTERKSAEFSRESRSKMSEEPKECLVSHCKIAVSNNRVNEV